MSKIVLLFDSTYGDAYFNGFAKALQNVGHDIFYANIHGLKDTTFLIEEIQKFSGDTLINYNNFFPYTFKKILPQRNLSIDIDSPANFRNVSDFLNDFLSNKRYYASIQSGYPEVLKMFFPEIKTLNNTFWLPPATDFVHQEKEYKRNILFIGTNWNYGLYKDFANLDIGTFKYLYKLFKNNYFFSVQDALNSIGKSNVRLSDFSFKWNLSGIIRVEYLSMLTDLGLEIYGSNWNTLVHNADVLELIHDKVIENSNDVMDLYNSSKICVNFSHPQATTGFSFRCMDIMASAACLLTEWKLDFDKLFGKYISNKVKDAIFYTDRFDMRQKAIRLLKDEKLRLQCVEECNHAIEMNGRWKDRIEILEQHLGLTRPINSVGTIINFNTLSSLQQKLCNEKKETISCKKQHSTIISFLLKKFHLARRIKR